MAKIEIQRKDEFNNKFRDIQIIVDGVKIGAVSNGQTKDFEVPIGSHSIIAKIDWCTSEELSFISNKNETKKFSLCGFENTGNFWTGLYYLTIGYKNYLRLIEL